jgi:hypothetical protein
VDGPVAGLLAQEIEDLNQAPVVLAQVFEVGAHLVGVLGAGDVAFEGAQGQGEQALSLGAAEVALDARNAIEQAVGELAPFGVLLPVLEDSGS